MPPIDLIQRRQMWPLNSCYRLTCQQDLVTIQSSRTINGRQFYFFSSILWLESFCGKHCFLTTLLGKRISSCSEALNNNAFELLRTNDINVFRLNDRLGGQ